MKKNRSYKADKYDGVELKGKQLKKLFSQYFDYLDRAYGYYEDFAEMAKEVVETYGNGWDVKNPEIFEKLIVLVDRHLVDLEKVDSEKYANLFMKYLEVVDKDLSRYKDVKEDED